MVCPPAKDGLVAVIVTAPVEADFIVTKQDPVDPVVQPVADRVPPVAVNETVTPGALLESWAVRVEVVNESAGMEDGLAERLIAPNVTVAVADM